MKKESLLITGPASGPLLILAHGAGAPMDSEWMEELTARLNENSIRVARFEFPYMQKRRKEGSKRPPDRPPILERTWKDVVGLFTETKNIFIGGKSMGARTACLVASQVNVKGVVGFGFPFHAPGKDPGKRLDALMDLKTRTCIIQGTRDTMGSKDEVDSYPLPSSMKLHWLTDGDHSLKPRKKSGFTLEGHLEEAARIAAAFIKKNC